MHKKAFLAACALGLAAFGTQAHAETVIPMQGQTPDQIQADVATCQAQAKTAYDQALASAGQPAPATSSAPPSGSRLRGAAAGAAVGAATAEVRGNQYDNYDRIDEDVQQEYRQNQAQDAAVAGAVVGGARQRQSRRQQQQQTEQQAQQQSAAGSQTADSASAQTYSACMSGRGYSLSP